MKRQLVIVEQGNGNGQFIDKNSDSVLKTTDLVGCVAILIEAKNHCYMIHSDSNTNGGIGSLSLVKGINALGLDKKAHYKIGLIGGTTKAGLNIKYIEIQKALPNTSLVVTYFNSDSAYLESTGLMAHTKNSLAQQMGINSKDLELISSPSYALR